MSNEILIRCCAPTMACLKTRNMFNCAFDSQKQMTEELRHFNQRIVFFITCFHIMFQYGQIASVFTYWSIIDKKIAVAPTAIFHVSLGENYASAVPGSPASTVMLCSCISFSAIRSSMVSFVRISSSTDMVS